MLKFVGRFGGLSIAVKGFWSLPGQNPNIDSAHGSNVGSPKENADWWHRLAISKLNK
jgi:hypothetical protein